MANNASLLKDKSCLLIAARPDHSGWIRDVIGNKETELLYIGLRKNIDIDIPNNVKFKILNTPELKEEIVLSL